MITNEREWSQRVRAVIGSNVDQAWPYGTTRPDKDKAERKALIGWAERNEVRYSDNGNCLHWLTRGRCSERDCTEGRNQRRDWMDHLTGWTRTGKPALLIAQPYSLSADDLADLAKVERDWNVSVYIDGRGWYGHGTVTITIENKSDDDAA